MKMKIELFQRSIQNKYKLPVTQWFFRIVARNGRVIAQSEGYLRYAACRATVNRLIDPATEFEVVINGKGKK